MTLPPTMLSRAEAYLAHRRHLGFKLDGPGGQTLSFARFADRAGHVGPFTSEIAIRWAKKLLLVAIPLRGRSASTY